MEQSPKVTEADKGDFLSVAYDPAVKPFTEYPLQLVRHLMDDLVKVKSGRVLDVGCGRGDQLHGFRTLGFDVVGIDAESPSGEPFEYYKCDIVSENFPIADHSVDVVIMKSVIEHLYYFQLPFIFSQIKRVLKPGGVLIVLTPDFRYNVKTFYEAFAHCSPYTTLSLEICLKMYGFKDVNTYVLTPLPSTWHSPFMRFLADVTRFLPFPRSWGKWFKWSKDRQAVAWGRTQ